MPVLLIGLFLFTTNFLNAQQNCEELVKLRDSQLINSFDQTMMEYKLNTNEKAKFQKLKDDALAIKTELSETGLTNSINGSFNDSRDGRVYKTVKIGNQTWMAENLNYNTSNSWCNQCETFGRLYNYNAALIACPSGWHLPSCAEWSTLVANCGGESVAGGKLKETGTTHWSSPNTDATNETGFTALPGGYHSYVGTFNDVGDHGDWWSSAESDKINAWYVDMCCNLGFLSRFKFSKTVGFSVRCVKD